MVAVFANNAPAFYAVTPRLAELLALEEKLARQGSDVALDDQLYQEPQTLLLSPGSPSIGLATRCRFYSAWRR